MKDFKNNIDKMVSKILSEEIEKKSKQVFEQIDEELKGNQKKLDVAEPKGKLTAADFKKLRGAKKHKKEVEENLYVGFNDEDEVLGDYKGDEEEEDEAEELSQQEPTYVGKGLADNKIKNQIRNKMFGSFDDEHGWFDNDDRSVKPDFDYDEEEEYHDFPSFMDKHGKNQKWFAPNDGERYFKSYQDKFGGKPFRVRLAKGLEEDNEGDEFEDGEDRYRDVPERLVKHMDNGRISGTHKYGVGYTPNEFGKSLGHSSHPTSIPNSTKFEDDDDYMNDEMEEGNAFSGALAQAKESGDDSFEVDGHKYPVKEAKGKKCPKCGMVDCKCNHKKETKESDEKWIQKTHMKKGALHKKLGVPEGDKIPVTKLKSLKAELHKKSEGDKKLSVADSKLLKQVNLALTLKSVKESKNSLRLTETELIDMIESLVLEQKAKDTSEKNNISKKEATGLKKTEKVLEKNKSEGDSYFKELVKKMTDYLKDSTKGKYEMDPENFPQSNYDMEKEHNEMKYHPSEAVEEYIEAFSYPGMTNLVYDEIKPDDERIGKQLKGDSMNGNAVRDKEGKALGNVVPSKVGERFKKNYDENLYGAEQMKASYKRQPQETIEVEGNGKTKGSLKSKQQGADKSSSINKATKILNTLESTENKKEKLVNEEMEKMKNLIGYNRKTQ